MAGHVGCPSMGEISQRMNLPGLLG